MPSTKTAWDRDADYYRNKPSALSDWPFPHSFLPDRGSRVLDAGCGAGTYLRMLSALSDHCHGVDRSFKMAAAAFPMAAAADITSLPFPDCRFDYVLSIGVLSHCGDPGRAIAECCRVLKPGGRLLLCAPNAYSFTALGRAATQRFNAYRHGKCVHFTLNSLIEGCAPHRVRRLDHFIWNREPVCLTRGFKIPYAILHYLNRACSGISSRCGDMIAALFHKEHDQS